MSFKDLRETKRVVRFYAIANKVGLKVKKVDRTRVKYVSGYWISFCVLDI